MNSSLVGTELCLNENTSANLEFRSMPIKSFCSTICVFVEEMPLLELKCPFSVDIYNVILFEAQIISRKKEIHMKNYLY